MRTDGQLSFKYSNPSVCITAVGQKYIILTKAYSSHYCTKTSNEKGDEMENVAKVQLWTDVLQWKREKCKTSRQTSQYKSTWKNKIPLKFSGNAMTFKHTAFSWKQWCCSANANVVATVFIATSSQSLASHSNLSLSSAYLSAAASRCWDIRVEAHFEFKPTISCISGRASQYMKWSNACNCLDNKGKRKLS